MRIGLLIFIAFAFGKTVSAQAPSVCSMLSQMKDAAASNFIPLTEAAYVEAETKYKSKIVFPGFAENNVLVDNSIGLYFVNGTTYFNTLDEAKNAYAPLKTSMDKCFGNTGTDKKTNRQPEANAWVITNQKDILNNTFHFETTLAIWQNTKTNQWVLEYLALRKRP